MEIAGSLDLLASGTTGLIPRNLTSTSGLAGFNARVNSSWVGMREPKSVTPSAQLTGLIKAMSAKSNREPTQLIKLGPFLLQETVFIRLARPPSSDIQDHDRGLIAFGIAHGAAGSQLFAALQHITPERRRDALLSDLRRRIAPVTALAKLARDVAAKIVAAELDDIIDTLKD
jgi:hypothetical protein